MLIIASVVTALEMFMNAYFHELYPDTWDIYSIDCNQLHHHRPCRKFCLKNGLWLSIKDGFLQDLFCFGSIHYRSD